jgi:ABC-type dipeptide/oligopeptide/nickel transport system ATPase component
MALDIDNLHVELDGDAGLVRAIEAMHLSLRQGETFALVGESGCGKSMTALALMRLLPENGHVTRGSVRLDGAELLSLPESRMRAVRGGRIGMIFQEPGTSLNPVMTVGDQVIEAIETHTPLRGDAARAKAVSWLHRVGLPDPPRRMADYPFQLSGGQKQRVMIAMTLAAEPDFLVADEPTTALDVTIQAQVLDLLRDLQEEQGMGLLLITHDLAVVAGFAHRVALMYAGQIVEVADSAQFFRAPQHPYAHLLLRALPDARKRGGGLVGHVHRLPLRPPLRPRDGRMPRGRTRPGGVALGAAGALPAVPRRGDGVAAAARGAGGPGYAVGGGHRGTTARCHRPHRAVCAAQRLAATEGAARDRRGRRVAVDRCRPHARARGRERQRQDHDGQGHRAAAARTRRGGRPRGVRRAGPLRPGRTGPAGGARGDPDRVPGSVRLAQSAPACAGRAGGGAARIAPRARRGGPPHTHRSPATRTSSPADSGSASPSRVRSRSNRA